MITPDQIKLLWVLARQIHLSDEDLHDVVLEGTGRDSIKKMTKREASAVIEVLKRAGAKITKKKKPRRTGPLPPNVVEIASQGQLALIQHLEKELGWDENPKRLQGFVRRITKTRAGVVRTKRDAQEVIEGLKAILAREQGKGGSGSRSVAKT